MKRRRLFVTLAVAALALTTLLILTALPLAGTAAPTVVSLSTNPKRINESAAAHSFIRSPFVDNSPGTTTRISAAPRLGRQPLESLSALNSTEATERGAHLSAFSVPSAASVVQSLGTTTRLSAALRSAPVMFIENVGQFDERARFQVRGGVGTMWLAEDAIWVTVLEKPSSPQPPSPNLEEGGAFLPSPKFGRGAGGEDQPRKGVNLRLTFPGANPHPRIEPFERLDTVVSYFIGNDPDQWHPDVPVWGGVRYVDLYPGIDLEITGETGRLVQRLLAQPGADLSAVRLWVEGAEALTMDREVLRLTTAVGKFTLPLLQAVTADGTPLPRVGEKPRVGANDITTPFTAEYPAAGSGPSSVVGATGSSDLLYSTFLGGSGGDRPYGLAVDSSGLVYVAGVTYSANFPVTPGAYDTSYNGAYDAFVTKLNATGSGLVYSTFLGGSSYDYAIGFAVDSGGAAYMAGITYSSNFPTTSGSYDTSFNGGQFDAFVTKLSATGSGLVYSTFLGGNSNEWAFALSIDASGAVYVAGQTYSANFPTTQGAYDTSFNGTYDAFVTKLNTLGSELVYSTFLGGSDGDWARALSVDTSGAAYVAGLTYSANFPTTLGAFQTTEGGNGDVFVTKLNTSGSGLDYSTYLGGSSDDEVDRAGIRVDASGAAYVSGVTFSSNFPTTSGAFQTMYRGNGDAFVTKLSATGSGLIYSTYLGGSGEDRGYDIAVDTSGAAYVSGVTFSSNFPTTSGAFQTMYRGNGDAFVTKLSATGSGLIYSTYLGGSGEDRGSTIKVDIPGNAYVAGFTLSADFPTTLGAHDTSYNGVEDAFVVKLAVGNIVTEARADIGMPYRTDRGCPSPYIGCGGPYHGFYYGVCTDLVIDAYNWGASLNLQNVISQDHRAHPGRYQYGTARWAEDILRYLRYNEQLLPHSQAYQPGDIAFFDYNASGVSDHVGVISEVDANGHPLRMVHATGSCEVNPSGRAFEQDWNSYYDQHVQGHGRLGGAGGLAASASETLQVLRITIDSPSVALALQDANGKTTSSSYDENLVAINNEAAIPYIPGGTYADLGAEKVITVTQPLSNTTQYFVELTGQAVVTYHLHIETLQDFSVTDSQVFTQPITTGETHNSAITLSAPGGTIEFTATSPNPSPVPDIPNSLELIGPADTPARATFTVAETGGQQALQNVVISATDLMDPIGGIISSTLFTITPNSFTVPAGGSQDVDVEVSLAGVTGGEYRGSLVITSDNGGTRMIPVELTATDFKLDAQPVSQTVMQSQTVTYTLALTAYKNFTSSVTLAITGLPTDTTSIIVPNPITPTASAALTVTTGLTTPTDTYGLVITGTGGGLVHSTTVPLTITVFGDLNWDCVVDIADIMQVASRWRCKCEDACYDPRYDLDGDCDIDIVDIMLVVKHWGETCE